MNLPIPVVGLDPAPDYAENVNSSLTLVDGHNHSIGSGVQITPDGLNISSDLTFLSNNATNLRSVRWSPQGSPLALPTDLSCAYVSGVDLYYNDGNGNQIRLTQSGSIVGTAGSITGLVAPASATYVSGSETFVWQSNVNKPANLDAGYIILRNNTVSSFGLTLQPPLAMASNFTITLPSLPVSQRFLTIDSSGNILTSTFVGGVTQNMLQARATGTSVAAGGVAVSASCGSFAISTVQTQITNFNLTITTTGRPVRILIQPAPAAVGGAYYSSAGNNIFLDFYNGVTFLARYNYPATAQTTSTFEFVDITVNGSPGTYNYIVYATMTTGTGLFSEYQMMVYEI